MPVEIFDEERFLRLSEAAKVCRIKKLKNLVKLKLRTSNRLYTLKVKPSKAEELVRRLKCEKLEI